MSWDEQLEYEEKHGRKGYEYNNLVNRASKMKSKAKFQLD